MKKLRIIGAAGVMLAVIIAFENEPDEPECISDECRVEKVRYLVQRSCRDAIQSVISARSLNGLTRPFFSSYRLLPNGTIYFYGDALEISAPDGSTGPGKYTCTWLPDGTLGWVILNGEILPPD